MSLLSPSLRIALMPDRVAAASGRACHEAAVASPGWSGALEALAELLAASGLRGRASVTLSHHFAAVHLLAAPPLVLKPAEMRGWIGDHLARQFGEAGRSLRFAWQTDAPGKPFLVSTIEPAALAELEAVLELASLKPVEVQPWLAQVWNRRAGRLGRGRAWLALAETGRLTLAAVEDGGLTRLRSTPVEDDAPAALSDLVKREALLAGEGTPAPLWIESVLPPLNWQRTGDARAVQTFDAKSEGLGAMLGVACAR